MRRYLTPTFSILLVLLFCISQATEPEYTACNEIVFSSTDEVMVIAGSAVPGDTIWAPVHMKTDSVVLGFVLIINYDHLFLAPIETSSGYVLAEQVGRFAGTDNFMALSSPNPHDSGAILCTFLPPLADTSTIPAGSGLIIKLAFEVKPYMPPNDSARFYFQATDHNFGCRISELALRWGESTVESVWPTTVPTWLVTDSADTGIPRIIDYYTSPRSIVAGDSSVLNWSVINLDSLSIEPGQGTYDAPEASLPVFPTATTTYELTAFGTEGIATAAVTVNVTQPGANRYPILDYIPDHYLLENSVLEFTVSATDPDGDTPYLAAAPLPAAASMVDSGNGVALFSWPVAAEDIGTHTLTFYAIDALSSELVDSLTIEITVIDQNLPPQGSYDNSSIDLIPEGDTIQFLVYAWDPDSTVPAITGHLSGRDTLAPNMTVVDSGNGVAVFTFVPDYFQGNNNPNHYYVSFTISDSENPLLTTTTSHIHMSIVNNNSGMETPTLEVSAGPGPYSLEEGQALVFNVIGSTTIGDLPIISGGNLPANAGLTLSPDAHDQEIMEFAFYPNFSQTGDYSVTFYADNAGLIDSLEVLISVAEGNQAPWIFVPPGQLDTVVEDGSLNLLVYAFDPDSVTPVLSAFLDGDDTLAHNMSFVDSGNGTGLFSFTPNRVQGHSPTPTFYFIRFAATDGLNPEISSFSPTVTIRVYDSGLPCCVLLTGDIDYSGNGLAQPDIRDLTLLVDYLFSEDEVIIPCQLIADCNGDATIDLQDLTRFVNFFFENGPLLSFCH